MAVRCNRDIDEPQICCKGLVCRESYHQTIHDCLKPSDFQVETLGEPECRGVKRKFSLNPFSQLLTHVHFITST